MIKDYIKTHISDGIYIYSEDNRHSNIWGWEDFSLSNFAIISKRETYYTEKNFAEHLHTHNFYELVIYISGDVEYTNGDLVFTPQPEESAIIINRPGESHTTRLLHTGEYKRYVLYFDEEFLAFFGGFLPFKDFLDSLSSFALPSSPSLTEKIISLFDCAIDELNSNKEFSLQNAYSNVLSLFSLIATEASHKAETTLIPENILAIKKYVDAHCTEIKNINAIADAFFYSREHISRLFKKYFNVNLSDYLARKKCEESTHLLIRGENVGNICFYCGFGSIPSYLRAFKRFYRMTPSEFAKENKKS